MATAFELTGGRALADVAGPLRAMGSWLGSLRLDHPEEVVETFAVWLATTMPWFTRRTARWRWSETSWAWRNRRKP